ATSSAVSAPGPQPTSTTLWTPDTFAKSAKSGASGDEYLPMKRSYLSAATAKLIGRGLYAARVLSRACAAAPAALLAVLPGATARGAEAELPLDQQVGQLVVLSFHGATAPAYVGTALRERHAAGVILFGGNVVSAAQLRGLTRTLREAGSRPLVA